MGILNARAESITANSAEIKWETDMDASTELSLGKQKDDGSFAMTDLPATGGDTLSHTYTLTGLESGAVYKADAKSFDPGMGDYMLCDDMTSPLQFSTPAADGDVDSIVYEADKTEISVGESCTITITCSYPDGPGANEKLCLSIVNGSPNGNPRGIFSPSEPVTDSNGVATVVFTAAHKGKCKIEVLADNKVIDLEIMIK